MKKTLLGMLIFQFLLNSSLWSLDSLFLSQPQPYPLFSGGLPYLPRPFTSENFPFHVELSLNWWNSFRFDFKQFTPHLTYVDAEGVLGSVTVQSSLTPDLSLGLRLEFQTLFAGILDTPIEAFHHLLAYRTRAGKMLAKISSAYTTPRMNIRSSTLTRGSVT